MVSNETVVNCRSCEREIEPGEGIQWYGDIYYCAECQAKRDAEEKRLHDKQQECGALLTKLIPTIEKLGSITNIRLGRGEYRSSVKVWTPRGVFSVTVDMDD